MLMQCPINQPLSVLFKLQISIIFSICVLSSLTPYIIIIFPSSNFFLPLMFSLISSVIHIKSSCQFSSFPILQPSFAIFSNFFPFINLPNTSHLCLFRHLFLCALFLRCTITHFHSIYTLIVAWSLSITSHKSSILAPTTFFMPLPSIYTQSSVNVFSSVYNVASFNPSQTQ